MVEKPGEIIIPGYIKQSRDINLFLNSESGEASLRGLKSSFKIKSNSN